MKFHNQLKRKTHCNKKKKPKHKQREQKNYNLRLKKNNITTKIENNTLSCVRTLYAPITHYLHKGGF